MIRNENNEYSFIKPYKGKFSTILLFGPPGAGKGTLGTFLSHAGSQYHLTSGAIFRSLATYSPAGRLYYSYAQRGELLPDEVTIEIWKYFVQGLIATNTYYPESQDLLLEGIPRTLGQAQMIGEYINVRHIIVLEVDKEVELLKRMEKKARLEGKLNGLDSDFEKNRLALYEESEEQILSHYPQHLISRINADQKPLAILRDVLVRLSHVLSHGPNNNSSK